MPVQTNIYCGIDDPDEAALVHSNGKTYRMEVYRVNRDGPGENVANELRASCYVEQDQGQEVFVFEAVVRSWADVGFDAEINYPRVLASGDYFVVHWIEGPIQFGDLHRATINPVPISGPATFTHQGAVSLDGAGLYDAVPITSGNPGSTTTDYIVARKIDSTHITVGRYNGLSWVDTAWLVNSVTTVGNHCLGAAADVQLNCVVVAFERAAGQANQLWTARWDLANGANFAQVRSFSAGTSATGSYTSVGLCKVHRSLGGSASNWFVLAEARPVAFNNDFQDRHVRYLAWTVLDTDAAPVCPAQSAYNLNLVSRPWSIRGTSSSGAQVYAATSFKNVHGSETQNTGATLWDQAYLYVMNFDVRSTLAADEADTVRPWACGNFVAQSGGGIFDARPAGQALTPAGQVGTLVKSLNHLSGVTRANLASPDRKVYTFCGLEFGQVVLAEDTSDDGLGPLGVAPINATVVSYRWHAGEPWSAIVDETDSDDQTFFGPYARTTYAHEPAGDGLVIAGGTPCMYDGRQVVEINYLYYPEITSCQGESVGDPGEGLQAGTYEYSCAYFWKDAQGQVHLSTMAVPNQLAIEGVEHAQITYGPGGADGGIIFVVFPGVGFNGSDVEIQYPVQPGDSDEDIAAGMAAAITSATATTLSGIVDSATSADESLQVTFEQGYALTELVPDFAAATTARATASDPSDVSNGTYTMNFFTPNGLVSVTYEAIAAESLTTVMTELRNAALDSAELQDFLSGVFTSVTGTGSFGDPVEFTIGYKRGVALINVAILVPGTDVGTSTTSGDDPSDVGTTVSYGLLGFSQWFVPLRSTVPVYDPNGNGAILQIRTMCCSLKDNEAHYPLAAPINIIVYRRLVGDTTWRRCGTPAFGVSPIDYPVNDPTYWTVGFTDSFQDLSGNDEFPLAIAGTSPELQAQTPSAGAVMAIWQDRVWLTTGTDKRIYYTKESQVVFGENFAAPQFHFANTFRVDSIEDEITAMVAMDSALVLFTQSGIYALEGTPNDNLGQGGDLSLQVIASGTGCINPRSTVLGPPGVFFQSRKGYMLLSRGYELDYVSSGAAVEDLIRDSGNVHGAVLLEDRHQIKLARYNSLLTYDYFQKQWSVRELPVPGADGTVVGMAAWNGYAGGEVCTALAHQTFLSLEQPEGLYWDRDIGAGHVVPVFADVTLDWIRLDGVAGCKRVYEIGVQLEKPNASVVHVDIEYDIDGSYTNTTTESFIYGSATPATGTIQVVPTADLLDGQTFTLTDGLGRSTTFHLNVSGTFELSSGSTDEDQIVDVSLVATASAVADVVGAAIDESWLAISTVSTSSGGLVTLRQLNPGTGGNTSISDTVTDPDWVNTNFAGGASTPAPAYLLVPNSIQKMSAFRLRVYEETNALAPTDNPTSLFENMKIQSVTIVYGAKEGLRQVPDTFKGSAA